MKMVYLASLALIGTLGLAADALAHGGGGYRGPPGGIPPGARVPNDPPPPPCVCADVDCDTCSAKDLRSGKRLAKRDQTTETLRDWSDLRQVRVTSTFRASVSGPIEAYASIAVGGALGVTAASIAQGETQLVASLRESEAARREYLITRRKKLDPLLLTRRAAGEYDLRAFPVRGDADTVVVVEGLALANEPCTRTRLYRDGDRHLAVVRMGAESSTRFAAFVDRKHGRALYFMSGRQARARFGQLARQAEEVSGIAALERAVKGEDDRVWVALETEKAPATGATPPDPVEPASPPPPDGSGPTTPGGAPPPTPVDPVVTASVTE